MIRGLAHVHLFCEGEGPKGRQSQLFFGGASTLALPVEPQQRPWSSYRSYAFGEARDANQPRGEAKTKIPTPAA
jgi:hypothetical protein